VYSLRGMRGLGESRRKGCPTLTDHRVVADERPVAAGDGPVLLVHAVAEERSVLLDPVGDAMAVGDDQRGALVSLRLAQRPEGLFGSAPIATRAT